MSIDFDVYTKDVLTVSQLVEFIADDGTLRAELTDSGHEIDRVLTTKSGEICFTISGPFMVDSIDLAEGVAAFLHGRGHLYQVLATTVEPEFPEIAERFARRLAGRLSGVMIDLQRDAGGRAAQNSVRSDADRYLHLHWFRPGSSREDLASVYLRLARELLAIAVPIKFGSHEPMQGRFPRDSDDVFDATYRKECGLTRLWFTGKTPAMDGWISQWHSKHRSWPQNIMTTFAFDESFTPEILDSLQRFFLRVAEDTGSFFAYAELNDAAFATAAPLLSRGHWEGLPDQPQWLTWFSSEYAELVQPYLIAGLTAAFPSGLLHRWTPSPSTAVEIKPLLAKDSWIPEELLPLRSPSSRRRILRSASVMPASLRAGNV